MRNELERIAGRLSEADILHLLQLKKQGGRKVVALRKKRDKLAASLALLDKRLAGLEGDVGEGGAEPARRGPKPGRPRKSGRRPGRPARTDAAKPAAAGGKAAAGGRATGLTAAVGSVLAKAKGGMRAEQIVAALPEAGMKVDDIDKMRKRVSIVLAARRKHFKAVARGLYKLRG